MSQLTFRVTDDLYNELQEIAEEERRKPTEVARALLERGLGSYRKDSLLFEPAVILSGSTDMKLAGEVSYHDANYNKSNPTESPRPIYSTPLSAGKDSKLGDEPRKIISTPLSKKETTGGTRKQKRR